VTPSAAYASEAEPPLLHITTLTTDYDRRRTYARTSLRPRRAYGP